MVLASVRDVEIRWHGRGGQGVVTASYVLAEASLVEGKYFQSFPEFGPERSGAPVLAYTRLSERPIAIPSGVAEPHIVVVLDPSLLGKADVVAGLRSDGLLLVNTAAEPGRVRCAVALRSARVATVDATRVSRECLGRNFPNVPILGALVRVEPLVSLEALTAALRRQLGEKLSAAVFEQNLRALWRGYEEVVQERAGSFEEV